MLETVHGAVRRLYKKSRIAPLNAIIIIIIIIIIIMCNTSSAFHVQHIVCHMVQRGSSAIKFDRVENAFDLNSFYSLLLWIPGQSLPDDVDKLLEDVASPSPLSSQDL